MNLDLPSDYKDFLMKYNGAQPKGEGYGFSVDWCSEKFKKIKDWDKALLHYLFALNIDDNELYKYYKMYRGRVPVETIPIGQDPGGNIILLGIRGGQYGKVYLWEHEYEVDADTGPDYSNVGIVSESFTDFINNLEIVE